MLEYGVWMHQHEKTVVALLKYINFPPCQVLATDLNGKKVFLTRYIRDQNLPSDFGFDPASPPPNAMVS